MLGQKPGSRGEFGIARENEGFRIAEATGVDTGDGEISRSAKFVVCNKCPNTGGERVKSPASEVGVWEKTADVGGADDGRWNLRGMVAGDVKVSGRHGRSKVRITFSRAGPAAL
jgi:hypothetical protein